MVLVQPCLWPDRGPHIFKDFVRNIKWHSTQGPQKPCKLKHDEQVRLRAASGLKGIVLHVLGSEDIDTTTILLRLSDTVSSISALVPATSLDALSGFGLNGSAIQLTDFDVVVDPWPRDGRRDLHFCLIVNELVYYEPLNAVQSDTVGKLLPVCERSNVQAILTQVADWKRSLSGALKTSRSMDIQTQVPFATQPSIAPTADPVDAHESQDPNLDADNSSIVQNGTSQYWSNKARSQLVRLVEERGGGGPSSQSPVPDSRLDPPQMQQWRDLYSSGRISKRIVTIPKGQQELLRAPSSWMPAKPGRRAPQGYLPNRDLEVITDFADHPEKYVTTDHGSKTRQSSEARSQNVSTKDDLVQYARQLQTTDREGTPQVSTVLDSQWPPSPTHHQQGALNEDLEDSSPHSYVSSDRNTVGTARAMPRLPPDSDDEDVASAKRQAHFHRAPSMDVKCYEDATSSNLKAIHRGMQHDNADSDSTRSCKRQQISSFPQIEDEGSDAEMRELDEHAEHEPSDVACAQISSTDSDNDEASTSEAEYTEAQLRIIIPTERSKARKARLIRRLENMPRNPKSSRKLAPVESIDLTNDGGAESESDSHSDLEIQSAKAVDEALASSPCPTVTRSTPRPTASLQVGRTPYTEMKHVQTKSSLASPSVGVDHTMPRQAVSRKVITPHSSTLSAATPKTQSTHRGPPCTGTLSSCDAQSSSRGPRDQGKPDLAPGFGSQKTDYPAEPTRVQENGRQFSASSQTFRCAKDTGTLSVSHTHDPPGEGPKRKAPQQTLEEPTKLKKARVYKVPANSPHFSQELVEFPQSTPVVVKYRREHFAGHSDWGEISDDTLKALRDGTEGIVSADRMNQETTGTSNERREGQTHVASEEMLGASHSGQQAQRPSPRDEVLEKELLEDVQTASLPVQHEAAGLETMIESDQLTPPSLHQHAPPTDAGQPVTALKQPFLGQQHCASLVAESSDAFNRFKQAYPAYPGSLQHFSTMCKKLRQLKIWKLFWDDFVVRHLTEYAVYTLKCLQKGLMQDTYEQWWDDNVAGTKYTLRVITPRALNGILGHQDQAWDVPPNQEISHQNNVSFASAGSAETSAVSVIPNPATTVTRKPSNQLSEPVSIGTTSGPAPHERDLVQGLPGTQATPQTHENSIGQGPPCTPSLSAVSDRAIGSLEQPAQGQGASANQISPSKSITIDLTDDRSGSSDLLAARGSPKHMRRSLPWDPSRAQKEASPSQSAVPARAFIATPTSSSVRGSVVELPRPSTRSANARIVSAPVRTVSSPTIASKPVPKILLKSRETFYKPMTAALRAWRPDPSSPFHQYQRDSAAIKPGNEQGFRSRR